MAVYSMADAHAHAPVPSSSRPYAATVSVRGARFDAMSYEL